MSSPTTARSGRVISVVVHDDESELRTPSQPLYSIPPEVSDVYTPIPPLPLGVAASCDLTRIAPCRPRAIGQVIEITGQVLDEEGRPVRDTLVEIWNANTHGRYSHSLDSGNTDSPLDPNFYGFGRLVTDNDGRYHLRTIKPGAYIARRDIQWWRPPHVHFSIIGNGLRLVTQMYFPGEPLNNRDYIHLYIPQQDRPRVIGVAAPPAPHGVTQYTFDIVVRGRFETPPDVD